MGIRRRGRDVNGILLLDKPIGLSSNQALTQAKILFNAKKAGHTGSLDPLASGMLPICFGEATKFSQFLLEADKEYLVDAKLGIRTTTGDAEGEIISTKPVSFTALQLERVLESFRGEIQQIPSMYSAIKFQGKPLYAYARQGIEIERPSRTVTIKELILLHATDDTLTIRVRCTKGTYIRTLVEDIGEVLGFGAHVSSLRRTYVEPYITAQMTSLEELRHVKENNIDELDTLLRPIDSALSDWPEIRLSSSVAYYLKQGQPVIVPRAPTSGWVRLFVDDDSFMGVGEVLDDGRVAPRRLTSTVCSKVGESSP